MLRIIKTEGYKDSDLFAKAITRRFKEEGLENALEIIDVSQSMTSDEYCELCDIYDVVLPLYPLPKDVSISRLRHTIRSNIDCVGCELKWMPITPSAILKKIKDSNAIDDIRDMRITILNRTERIGLPLAVELSRLGATVTICNSRTNDKDLEQLVKNSNIIITAMGNPNVIDYKHINKGQIWIDCSGDVSKQCLIDEINDGMGVYYGMRDVGNWTLDELMSRYYMEMGY